MPADSLDRQLHELELLLSGQREDDAGALELLRGAAGDVSALFSGSAPPPLEEEEATALAADRLLSLGLSRAAVPPLLEFNRRAIGYRLLILVFRSLEAHPELRALGGFASAFMGAETFLRVAQSAMAQVRALRGAGGPGRAGGGSGTAPVGGAPDLPDLAPYLNVLRAYDLLHFSVLSYVYCEAAVVSPRELSELSQVLVEMDLCVRDMSQFVVGEVAGGNGGAGNADSAGGAGNPNPAAVGGAPGLAGVSGPSGSSGSAVAAEHPALSILKLATHVLSLAAAAPTVSRARRFSADTTFVRPAVQVFALPAGGDPAAAGRPFSAVLPTAFVTPCLSQRPEVAGLLSSASTLVPVEGTALRQVLDQAFSALVSSPLGKAIEEGVAEVRASSISRGNPAVLASARTLFGESYDPNVLARTMGASGGPVSYSSAVTLEQKISRASECLAEQLGSRVYEPQRGRRSLAAALSSPAPGLRPLLNLLHVLSEIFSGALAPEATGGQPDEELYSRRLMEELGEEEFVLAVGRLATVALSIYCAPGSSDAAGAADGVFAASPFLASSLGVYSMALCVYPLQDLAAVGAGLRRTLGACAGFAFSYCDPIVRQIRLGDARRYHAALGALVEETNLWELQQVEEASGGAAGEAEGRGPVSRADSVASLASFASMGGLGGLAAREEGAARRRKRGEVFSRLSEPITCLSGSLLFYLASILQVGHLDAFAGLDEEGLAAVIIRWCVGQAQTPGEVSAALALLAVCAGHARGDPYCLEGAAGVVREIVQSRATAQFEVPEALANLVNEQRERHPRLHAATVSRNAWVSDGRQDAWQGGSSVSATPQAQARILSVYSTGRELSGEVFGAVGAIMSPFGTRYLSLFLDKQGLLPESLGWGTQGLGGAGANLGSEDFLGPRAASGEAGRGGPGAASEVAGELGGEFGELGDLGGRSALQPRLQDPFPEDLFPLAPAQPELLAAIDEALPQTAEAPALTPFASAQLAHVLQILARVNLCPAKAALLGARVAVQQLRLPPASRAPELLDAALELLVSANAQENEALRRLVTDTGSVPDSFARHVTLWLLRGEQLGRLLQPVELAASAESPAGAVGVAGGISTGVEAIFASHAPLAPDAVAFASPYLGRLMRLASEYLRSTASLHIDFPSSEACAALSALLPRVVHSLGAVLEAFQRETAGAAGGLVCAAVELCMLACSGSVSGLLRRWNLPARLRDRDALEAPAEVATAPVLEQLRPLAAVVLASVSQSLMILQNLAGILANGATSALYGPGGLALVSRRGGSAASGALGALGAFGRPAGVAGPGGAAGGSASTAPAASASAHLFPTSPLASQPVLQAAAEFLSRILCLCRSQGQLFSLPPARELACALEAISCQAPLMADLPGRYDVSSLSPEEIGQRLELVESPGQPGAPGVSSVGAAGTSAAGAAPAWGSYGGAYGGAYGGSFGLAARPAAASPTLRPRTGPVSFSTLLLAYFDPSSGESLVAAVSRLLDNIKAAVGIRALLSSLRTSAGIRDALVRLAQNFLRTEVIAEGVLGFLGAAGSAGAAGPTGLPAMAGAARGTLFAEIGRADPGYFEFLDLFIRGRISPAEELPSDQDPAAVLRARAPLGPGADPDCALYPPLEDFLVNNSRHLLLTPRLSASVYTTLGLYLETAGLVAGSAAGLAAWEGEAESSAPHAQRAPRATLAAMAARAAICLTRASARPILDAFGDCATEIRDLAMQATERAEALFAGRGLTEYNLSEMIRAMRYSGDCLRAVGGLLRLLTSSSHILFSAPEAGEDENRSALLVSLFGSHGASLFYPESLPNHLCEALSVLRGGAPIQQTSEAAAVLRQLRQCGAEVLEPQDPDGIEAALDGQQEGLQIQKMLALVCTPLSVSPLSGDGEASYLLMLSMHVARLVCCFPKPVVDAAARPAVLAALSKSADGSIPLGEMERELLMSGAARQAEGVRAPGEDVPGAPGRAFMGSPIQRALLQAAGVNRWISLTEAAEECAQFYAAFLGEIFMKMRRRGGAGQDEEDDGPGFRPNCPSALAAVQRSALLGCMQCAAILPAVYLQRQAKGELLAAGEGIDSAVLLPVVLLSSEAREMLTDSPPRGVVFFPSSLAEMAVLCLRAVCTASEAQASLGTALPALSAVLELVFYAANLGVSPPRFLSAFSERLLTEPGFSEIFDSAASTVVEVVEGGTRLLRSGGLGPEHHYALSCLPLLLELGQLCDDPALPVLQRSLKRRLFPSALRQLEVLGVGCSAGPQLPSAETLYVRQLLLVAQRMTSALDSEESCRLLECVFRNWDGVLAAAGNQGQGAQVSAPAAGPSAASSAVGSSQPGEQFLGQTLGQAPGRQLAGMTVSAPPGSSVFLSDAEAAASVSGELTRYFNDLATSQAVGPAEFLSFAEDVAVPGEVLSQNHYRLLARSPAYRLHLVALGVLGLAAAALHGCVRGVGSGAPLASAVGSAAGSAGAGSTLESVRPGSAARLSSTVQGAGPLGAATPSAAGGSGLQQALSLLPEGRLTSLVQGFSLVASLAQTATGGLMCPLGNALPHLAALAMEEARLALEISRYVPRERLRLLPGLRVIVDALPELLCRSVGQRERSGAVDDRALPIAEETVLALADGALGFLCDSLASEMEDFDPAATRDAEAARLRAARERVEAWLPGCAGLLEALRAKEAPGDDLCAVLVTLCAQKLAVCAQLALHASYEHVRRQASRIESLRVPLSGISDLSPVLKRVARVCSAPPPGAGDSEFLRAAFSSLRETAEVLLSCV